MSDDKFPPPGTGESTTTRGEDHAKSNDEPGRIDMGDDETGRPTGGSSARMVTGVDPKESVSDQS